jgi:hypothetical protein
LTIADRIGELTETAGIGNADGTRFEPGDRARLEPDDREAEHWQDHD